MDNSHNSNNQYNNDTIISPTLNQNEIRKSDRIRNISYKRYDFEDFDDNEKRPIKRRKTKINANKKPIKETSSLQKSNILASSQIRKATLHNLGRTCYVNSILQVLRSTPKICCMIYNLWHNVIFICFKLKTLDLLSAGISLKPFIYLKNISELFSKMDTVEKNVTLISPNQYDNKGDRFLTHPLIVCPHTLILTTNLLYSNFKSIDYDFDAKEFLDFILQRLQECYQLVDRITKLIELCEFNKITDLLLHDLTMINLINFSIDNTNDTETCEQCNEFLKINETLIKSSLYEIADEKHGSNSHLFDIKTALFEMKKITVISCTNCKKNDMKEVQCHYDLLIGFDNEIKDSNLNMKRITNRKFDDVESEIQARNWIMDITKPFAERVEDHRCDSCRNTNVINHLEKIVSLSLILVIHLKRFDSDLKKIKKLQPYPMEIGCILDGCKGIDCTNYDHRYTLFGIVVHDGVSMENGHYWSVVKKSDKENIWIKFNDSKILFKTTDQFLSSDLSGRFAITPYILFYKKMSLTDDMNNSDLI